MQILTPLELEKLIAEISKKDIKMTDHDEIYTEYEKGAEYSEIFTLGRLALNVRKARVRANDAYETFEACEEAVLAAENELEDYIQKDTV